MPALFYLSHDRQKRGPFTVSQLQEMISAGRLQPADLILPDGSGRWVPAQSIEALVEAFRTSTAITESPRGLADPPLLEAITPSRRRNRRDSFDDDDDVPSVANTEINRQLITNFRQQIHALGAFWILIGALSLLVSVVALNNQAARGVVGGGGFVVIRLDVGVAVVVAALGVAWIAIGILACLKNVVAVYVGLALSYLSLLANLVQINVIGMLILALVIAQAHRVLSWANKMRRAGVAFTVKP